MFWRGRGRWHLAGMMREVRRMVRMLQFYADRLAGLLNRPLAESYSPFINSPTVTVGGVRVS
jgi:hypothetical protein